MNVPNRDMLDALGRAEFRVLGPMSRGPEEQGVWEGCDIDYRAPRIERISRKWEDFYISLSWIRSCAPEEATYLPCSSAVAFKVLGGRLEISTGISLTELSLPPPRIVSELALGSTHQMISQLHWSSVRALDAPALVLAVSDDPWPREHKPRHHLAGTVKPISDATRRSMFEVLQSFYI